MCERTVSHAACAFRRTPSYERAPQRSEERSSRNRADMSLMDAIEDGGPMSDFYPFIIAGLVSGAVYGLAATGLVLTYKTSGIFNFAHGALATVAAYVFYWLHVRHHVDWKPAAFVSVLVVGPLLGLVMERFATQLGRRRTAFKIV